MIFRLMVSLAKQHTKAINISATLVSLLLFFFFFFFDVKLSFSLLPLQIPHEEGSLNPLSVVQWFKFRFMACFKLPFTSSFNASFYNASVTS